LSRKYSEVKVYKGKGKTYRVHTGPKGGRYIEVKGRRRYLDGMRVHSMKRGAHRRY
jgi:hypothetical protein